MADVYNLLEGPPRTSNEIYMMHIIKTQLINQQKHRYCPLALHLQRPTCWLAATKKKVVIHRNDLRNERRSHCPLTIKWWTPSHKHGLLHASSRTCLDLYIFTHKLRLLAVPAVLVLFLGFRVNQMVDANYSQHSCKELDRSNGCMDAYMDDDMGILAHLLTAQHQRWTIFKTVINLFSICFQPI
jgi:hypothetical protein